MGVYRSAFRSDYCPAVKQLFTVKIMANISEKSVATANDPGKWLGRVIIGVLLGEAIWNLIVSSMNNLFVPWLGDVMGQSSGLPASFAQRPYNYPEFFVSFWESCIAALTAAVLNYFLQRQSSSRVNPGKTAVPVNPAVAPVLISQNPTLRPSFPGAVSTDCSGTRSAACPRDVSISRRLSTSSSYRSRTRRQTYPGCAGIEP